MQAKTLPALLISLANNYFRKFKIFEFLLRYPCPERVDWLYFVAHAENGLRKVEVRLLARDEKLPALCT